MGALARHSRAGGIGSLLLLALVALIFFSDALDSRSGVDRSLERRATSDEEPAQPAYVPE